MNRAYASSIFTPPLYRVSIGLAPTIDDAPYNICRLEKLICAGECQRVRGVGRGVGARTVAMVTELLGLRGVRGPRNVWSPFSPQFQESRGRVSLR